MISQIKAVIDVGTNSVKLLVAEVAGETVVPLFETSRQTRLGRGLYQTHQLQTSAILDTADAVRGFLATAEKMNARDVRVVATSAARDAINVNEMVSAVHELSGANLEVISGGEEAELVYRGVRSGIDADGDAVMIVDVGGGSTEIIVGSGVHPTFHRSYQLGTVRLMERCRHSDPPTEAEFSDVQDCLTTVIDEIISPDLKRAGVPSEELKLIGTGGTTTLLARMHKQMTGFDRDVIERTVLTKSDLTDWRVRLWAMTAAERSNIVGLPLEKADVIMMGVAIYERILEMVSCPEIRVSLRGLRFGALLLDQAG